MYFVKAISDLGIKWLPGEGYDFGGYLYFRNAPLGRRFQKKP
jgi:hypothetical protein